MKTKARKTNLNVALKVACVQTRRTQRVLSHQMKIGEARFSEIIWQKGVPPTPDEQDAIVRVLRRHGVQCSASHFFPVLSEAIA